MVSLIIPTFNKASRLKITLNYLKYLKLHEYTELIIVNDGSEDNTVQIVERFFLSLHENYFKNVKLINVSNGGRSHARNIGIQNASFELLIFIDDDVIVNPDFVKKHLELFQKNKNCAIHGIVYSLPFLKFFVDPESGLLYNGKNASGTMISQLIKKNLDYQTLYNSYLSRYCKLGEFEKDIMYIYKNSCESDSVVRWIGAVGGNFAVSKRIIEEVGGYDACFGKLWGCEDLELGYRLYLKGIKFLYNEASCIFHMNHFRENYEREHSINMNCFLSKYEDENVKLLESYFENKISIFDWKNMIMGNSGNNLNLM